MVLGREWLSGISGAGDEGGWGGKKGWRFRDCVLRVWWQWIYVILARVDRWTPKEEGKREMGASCSGGAGVSRACRGCAGKMFLGASGI